MFREKVNQAQLLEEGVAKYLKVSVGPPYPSRLSGDGPGGQWDQEHGVGLSQSKEVTSNLRRKDRHSQYPATHKETVLYYDWMYLCYAPNHLEPYRAREVAGHDDDQVLDLSVHFGRKLHIGELSHWHTKKYIHLTFHWLQLD